MPAGNACTIREARLPEDLPVLQSIRHRVFVEELGIPESLEWDGQDQSSRHVLAYSARQEAVGTGRLGPDGRIGRIAVLPPWRRTGIGRAILDALLRLAAHGGHQYVFLYAQRDVVGLYRNAGFTERGQPFMAAGIEHVKMEKTPDVGNNEVR